MNNNYYHIFNYKTINDSVYGNIGLSKIEVELLDTRAMQRLRRIRQMGFSSYVFPDGEHSRFAHSLGVLYIMGRFCDVLYRNNEISLEDVQLLRIAALLHDVGHYPFSHLCETVYSYIDAKNNSILENEPFRTISLLSDLSNHIKRKTVDHEHLGANVIIYDKQINDILKANNIDAELVGKIITGEIGVHNNSIVYAQLMHSSLDADRMDYLLRDSSQAGVVFGSVDFNYIINNIKKVKYQLNNDNNNQYEIIAINSKAQHAVEHFLMARYFHYSQTVLHKTSLAFEAVAKTLLYKMISEEKDEFYISFDNLVKSIGSDKFYHFTDDFMWTKLKAYAEKSEDKLVKILWRTLAERKKPIIILYEKDIVLKRKSKAEKQSINDPDFFLLKWILERHHKEISEKCGIDMEQIGFCTSTVNIESLPSFMKIEECNDLGEESLRDAIKLINKENKVSFLASDTTSLINKMVDYSAVSLVVFVVDPDQKIEKGKIKDVILSMIK